MIDEGVVTYYTPRYLLVSLLSLLFFVTVARCLLPVWYSRIGALLLRDRKLASPVGVAFRRRPVGADGEGVVVPECVELFAGLDEEAEGVDAVEVFEDEEVDFGWEGEERWHGLGMEIFWP